MLDIAVRKVLGTLAIDVAFQAIDGVTVLFGPSGAGKSSVLNMISGLMLPDAGSIALNGTTLFGQGINLPPDKRRVGHVFQDALLFPHLNVRQNLLFGARSSKDTEEVVTLLGLQNLLDRRPHTLSGGEAQRVAIGRALLSAPELLVMDEPMASLDDDRKEKLLPFLKDLRRRARTPIVYVTHSVDEAFRLGDRIILMERGRVIDQGPPGTIFAPSHARFASDLPRGGVLVGTVKRHHPEDHLTEIDVAGNKVLVRQAAYAPGDRIRLRLDASDIALSLTPPTGLSIQNRLSSRIVRMEDDAAGQVKLLLELQDGQHLTAALTARAARDMGLQPDAQVFALFKSVSVTPGQVD